MLVIRDFTDKDIIKVVELFSAVSNQRNVPNAFNNIFMEIESCFLKAYQTFCLRSPPILLFTLTLVHSTSDRALMLRRARIPRILSSKQGNRTVIERLLRCLYANLKSNEYS